MYLAEAIKEKDLVSKRMNWLYSRIKDLSISTDDTDIKLNQKLAETKVKDLENLYKEFQKYSIVISRAKVIAKIKLNDEEFSIADAENILEAMRVKLSYYEELVDHIRKFSSDPQTFLCMDLEMVHDKINSTISDIKSIEISIERALWIIEV